MRFPGFDTHAGKGAVIERLGSGGSGAVRNRAAAAAEVEMRFHCLLFFVCLLNISAISLDREAFTFTHYDLEARIEPPQQRLGVRGKVTLRNDSNAAQKNAVLQISSSLNWLSIQIDSKPAQFLSQAYTSDIDHTGALSEAVITLPRAVEPKGTITLEIGYEGTIPQDATRLTRIGAPAEDAKHSDWDQISSSFTAIRGIGYVAWYPVATEAASLTETDDVLDTVGRWKQREGESEMKIKFSQSGDTGAGLPTLYCNGMGQPGGYEQMGRAYSSWSYCTFLLNRNVPVFAIGQYQALDRPQVNISYLPDHKSQAEDYASAVEETAPYIEKWFGDHRETREFKAEVIEIPDIQAVPFESGNMLLMPLTGKDMTLLLSSIQQLTHVIFPSHRAWMFDGLTRYAQLSFLQEREGRSAVITYLQNHERALLDFEKSYSAANDKAVNSLINSNNDFYIQTKAMNVWWMLRDIVGETALHAALHNYKADDDKSPQYMQRLIEAQAHKDLEWFFDDWVYRDHGLPDLRIASVYPRELVNGGYMVTVTVENRGSAGAEVPVRLHMANGENSERLIVPAKSTASVRIVCPSFPQQATVNDGSVPEADESNNVYKIEH
jgi:hypothetical protein